MSIVAYTQSSESPELSELAVGVTPLNGTLSMKKESGADDTRTVSNNEQTEIGQLLAAPMCALNSVLGLKVGALIRNSVCHLQWQSQHWNF